MSRALTRDGAATKEGKDQEKKAPAYGAMSRRLRVWLRPGPETPQDPLSLTGDAVEPGHVSKEIP